MTKPCYKSEIHALRNAIHRCHNEDHAAYYNYGARGITVCDEWRAKRGWVSFIDHIGPKPSPELTLERIDNDRGYEPGNVRWATRKEQAANRRPCNWVGRQSAARGNLKSPVTINGVTKGVAQWATEVGLDASTITYRIKQGFTGSDLLAPKHSLPRKAGLA